MKLKDQSQELAKMVDQLAAPQAVADLSDAIPEELEEPEPLFTIDYKKEMREAVKKARRSIKTMLKTIIPAEYIDDPYITDKIEQDAESLGRLYYQQHIIEKVEEANVNAIGNGNLSARLFDTFNQTAKSHSDLAKQISDTQTAIRKSYIDVILDVKAKSKLASKPFLAAGAAPLQVTDKSTEFSRVFVGTKDLVKSLHMKRGDGATLLKDNQIEEI